MKLSVEEEVKHGLIEAKYQYPATCTTFNKLGEVVATRTVTHNVAKTKELRKLYPELKKEIDRIVITKKPRKESTNTSKLFPDKNVWRMMNKLGKE